MVYNVNEGADLRHLHEERDSGGLYEHGKIIIDMLSVEFTEAEKKQLFIEDGFEQGRKIGQEEGREEERERLNRLGIMLEEAGRVNDLLRSMKDPDYQRQLLEEFGL